MYSMCMYEEFDLFIFVGQYARKSVLLNLCETERENQLSWIRIEIDHLTNLKQLGNLIPIFCYAAMIHILFVYYFKFLNVL